MKNMRVAAVLAIMISILYDATELPEEPIPTVYVEPPPLESALHWIIPKKYGIETFIDQKTGRWAYDVTEDPVAHWKWQKEQMGWKD